MCKKNNLDSQCLRDTVEALCDFIFLFQFTRPVLENSSYMNIQVVLIRSKDSNDMQFRTLNPVLNNIILIIQNNRI